MNDGDDTYPRPIAPPDLVQQLASDVGGTITECAALPDGSGFAVMSMPLPKNHWLYADDGRFEPPPMPFRMAKDAVVGIIIIPNAREAASLSTTLNREQFAETIRAVGRYAYRASTMNGKESDLDPDALLRNLVVGMLGYWTADGLSSDAWANPSTENPTL